MRLEHGWTEASRVSEKVELMAAYVTAIHGQRPNERDSQYTSDLMGPDSGTVMSKALATLPLRQTNRHH